MVALELGIENSVVGWCDHLGETYAVPLHSI